ncbi:hypothetical protein F0562_003376 [Nyssa sinensis]|uniref:Uncharacterized protein n=1 Tax=Nyssa sinensis TaxID=561372 RepID=A0A5J5BZ66_9ASTE|nr:hypothetical protein F0562_003376 [Nyssa sinensis]
MMVRRRLWGMMGVVVLEVWSAVVMERLCGGAISSAGGEGAVVGAATPEMAGAVEMTGDGSAGAVVGDGGTIMDGGYGGRVGGVDRDEVAGSDGGGAVVMGSRRGEEEVLRLRAVGVTGGRRWLWWNG